MFINGTVSVWAAEKGWLPLLPLRKIIWHYSWKMTQHDSADSPRGHWSAELPDELTAAWICVSVCVSMFWYRLYFCVGTSHAFPSQDISHLKRCLLVAERYDLRWYVKFRLWPMIKKLSFVWMCGRVVRSWAQAPQLLDTQCVAQRHSSSSQFDATLGCKPVAQAQPTSDFPLNTTSRFVIVLTMLIRLRTSWAAWGNQL